MSYNASAPPAPSAPPMPEYDSVQIALMGLASQYQIDPHYIIKLRKLMGMDIVIIGDDSGSMAHASDAFPSSDPFARKISRFDELKIIMTQIMGIATSMDDDGVDVYFMNRPDARNVTSNDQISHLFDAPPSGSTPLVRTFNRAIADKMATLQGGEKELLVIVITDGVPDEGIDAFKEAVKLKPKNVHVSIAACTDDENVMIHLNKMDGMIPFVDICDDYRSELKQILAVQGKNFPFSYGDWVCKILLGSIDPYFDALDEKPVDIESGEVKPYVSSLITRTPVTATVVPASSSWWCCW